MSPLDLAVVIAYLVGIAALGIYQTVRVKTSGDYFTGGRKFSKFLMVMHALGTGTHADDPVGVAGAAYQRGISGIWYTYAYLFVTPFYWIMAPLFRRSRFITTADFFSYRFGSKMGTLYTVMGIIIFSLFTGTILRGTGTIVEAVTEGAVPDWVAIAAMTVIFVAYGFAGGLIATVVTEAIQGVLIVVMSLLLVPFGLVAVGGFSGLHRWVEKASPTVDLFSLAAPEEITTTWIIVASIMMLIGIVAHPHIMEVCSTGKTEFEGRVGFTYGNFIKRFCAMGWAFTGLIMVALVAKGDVPPPAAGDREWAFGMGIRHLLPAGATGLMFAAILAAQMSSLSAFMVAGGALFARNIYKQYIKPDAGDQSVLAIGRVTGLLVVFLGLLVAFVITGVAEGLTWFWSVTGILGVSIWFGVLWRRANRVGAWSSFLLMTAIWLVLGPIGMRFRDLLGLDFLGMFGEKADLPKLVACYLPAGILAMIVGSLVTPPEDKQRMDHFYLLLRTPVGREEELEKAGVEVVYKGSTEPHPWEINHPVLVNVLGFIAGLLFALAILGILWGLTRIGA